MSTPATESNGAIEGHHHSMAVDINPQMENFERQIRNLVDVYESEESTVGRRELLRQALKETNESLQSLTERMDYMKKQIDGILFEVYQLVGIFSVFEGVVYTAVLQSNRCTCQHVWSPISLCLLVYVAICIVANQKFRGIQALEATTQRDEKDRKVVL
jgi:hypothetical protein